MSQVQPASVPTLKPPPQRPQTAQPGRKTRSFRRTKKKFERIAKAPAAAPAAPKADPAPLVTDEERSKLSASQLEFLERKRLAAKGLAPAMPQRCNCPQCAGTGTAVCHQCNGSGMNSSDLAASMFQNDRGVIVQRNGLSDNRWFFTQDGPCWLCRGQRTIGCTTCGGSGMRSLAAYNVD